jgi:hypothetical protein
VVIQWLRAGVETQTPHGQKMKDVHPQLSAVIVPTAAQQCRNRGPADGHFRNQLSKSVFIQAPSPITVHQADILHERAVEKFLLGDHMECPALRGREGPADRQLALDDRPSRATRGFDFHETFSVVEHFDQEIRHDVTDAGGFPFLLRRSGGTFKKPDVDAPLHVVPSVPDLQRLFLDVGYLRASRQDDCGGGLQLPLATNRTSLLWARHQEK